MWSALPPIELDELINSGPVERGFYLGLQSPDSASQLTNRLVNLLDQESELEPIPPFSQRKLSYTPFRYWRRNSRIGQLFWIDSGHIFDASLLKAETDRHGLDVDRVSRAIRVIRPFSALQYVRMLEKVPNPALYAPMSEGGSQPALQRDGLVQSHAMWWTPLVIISDLLGPFLDPSLSDPVRSQLFQSFLRRLSFLRQRAIVLGLVNEVSQKIDHTHPLASVFRMARPINLPVEILAA